MTSIQWDATVETEDGHNVKARIVAQRHEQTANDGTLDVWASIESVECVSPVVDPDLDIPFDVAVIYGPGDSVLSDLSRRELSRLEFYAEEEMRRDDQQRRAEMRGDL